MVENKPNQVPERYFTSVGDVTLFLFLTPMTGFHVDLLATLIHKVTRLPLIVGIILVFSGSLLPLWIWNPSGTVIYPIIASVFLFLFLIFGWVSSDKEKAINGGNLEHTVQTHMVLLAIYMTAFAIKKFREPIKDKAELETGWLDVLSSWFC